MLPALEKIQGSFGGPEKVSLADLIVLGGNAAVEAAAAKRNVNVKVPFTPGRGDASQDMTDVESFGYLEPLAEAFRNYNHPSPYQLVDKAQLLGLSTKQMTVLVGGLRVLGVTNDDLGVLML